MNIEDIQIIGENDYGWQFGVGRVADRWLGLGLESQAKRGSRAAFAAEGLPVQPGYLHVIPDVSEGVLLGLPDKDKAIRLTGAVAQNPEHCFGGIARWFVPPALRGKPDDFRCGHCDRVGCAGECQEAFSDFGPEGP